AVRAAPTTLEDYLAADHATVVYEPRRAPAPDPTLEARAIRRRLVPPVPGVSGLPALPKGRALLAPAPALLQPSPMPDLAPAEPPLPCPGMPMYLIWHRQHQADPAHRWLREQILALAPTAVPGG